MNFIKNILGRIFALWAIIVFCISMFFVWIPVWIISDYKEPERTIGIFKIFNVWMKFFFVLTGIRRIFKGKENLKEGENYIVICNHSSFLDVALASPGIPGPNKTIAKIEMSRIPLFGAIYKSGSILVDRKSEKSRKRSYVKMKEVLEMGLHMCIYPEGTRNKTSEPLQRFHDGAFKLAADTGKAIIPAVIFYTNKVMPANKTFYFWPHKVEMHFLDAIIINGKSAEELKQTSFDVMRDYYMQHCNKQEGRNRQ